MNVFLVSTGVFLLANAQHFFALHNNVTSDAACPCFVEMHISTSEGLGQRMMEWLIGVRIAYEIECTFVAPTRDTLFGAGRHGDYYNFSSLFMSEANGKEFDSEKLREEPWLSVIRRTEALQMPIPPRFLGPNSTEKCFTVFTVNGRSCPMAPGSWCFQDPWLFDGVMSELRERFTQNVAADYCKPVTEAIVMHLRIGDITINFGEEYYNNVLSAVAAVVARNNLTKQLVFVQECPGCTINHLHQVHEKMIAALCNKYDFRCTFEPHLGIYEAMRRMICSEILVTSGSSFSMVAGAITSAPVVFVQNKDDGCPKCASSAQNVFPDSHGTIRGKELEKLDYLVRIRLHQRSFLHALGGSNAYALLVKRK